MSGNRNQRPVSGAFANTHHIAFSVYFDIRQTMLAQHFEIDPGTFLFLEGRRFDFGELDDLANEAVVVAVDEVLGRLELFVIDDTLRRRLRRLGPCAAAHERENQNEGYPNSDLHKQLLLQQSSRRPCLSFASR